MSAGRAPGRSQAGPHPLGGSTDVPVGRGVVMTPFCRLGARFKIQRHVWLRVGCRLQCLAWRIATAVGGKAAIRSAESY